MNNDSLNQFRRRLAQINGIKLSSDNTVNEEQLHEKKDMSVDQMIKHKDPKVRAMAMRHDDATSDHITQGLKDKNSDVAYAALDTISQSHKLLKPNHLSVALDHPDPWVRIQALKHNTTSGENLVKALHDKDPMVRSRAYGHSKYKKQVPKEIQAKVKAKPYMSWGEPAMGGHNVERLKD